MARLTWFVPALGLFLANGVYGITLNQAQNLRADPKKADAKDKKEGAPKKEAKPVDLSKPMPLKAQEQGFTGKKVQHEDGKTAASDWHKEYKNPSFTHLAAEPKKKAEAKGKKEDKKDAKPVDLSKPMPLKAQEQGFTGKKVEHEDGKTVSSDWHKEYKTPSFTHLAAEPKKEAKSKKEDKKDSKVVDLSKKMPLKAQEQGFTGKKVQHEDGKTKTDDWHKEYGPKSSFTHLRAEPKKAEAKKAEAKKDVTQDLSKPMPLKAQEHGYSGDHVQHEDGKTKTSDWRDEYGHATPSPPSPKKSGCVQSGSVAAAMLVLTALLFSQ